MTPQISLNLGSARDCHASRNISFLLVIVTPRLLSINRQIDVMEANVS